MQRKTSADQNSRASSPSLDHYTGWQDIQEQEENSDGRKVEAWEEDNSLSAQDLASINRESSLYEKERRHNIIRNQRMLKDMQLELLAQQAITGKKASEGRSDRARERTQ